MMLPEPQSPAEAYTLERLRSLKNALIGNPVAKLELVQTDPLAVHQVVNCLNSPSTNSPISEWTPIEASHVLSSLCFGPPEIVRALLDARAPEALLHALSICAPSGSANASAALRSALARAFRSVVIAIANVAGPHNESNGLGPFPLKGDTVVIAKRALELVFQLDSLDIFLPYLTDPSQGVSVSICHLLASSLRSSTHRRSVANWMSPSERALEVKGKRGWEKAETKSHSSGGWIARTMVDLVKRDDIKMREGALLALAAIAKGNHALASSLCLPPPEADKTIPLALQTPYAMFMDLCKARSPFVRLAACLCVTNVLRASSASPPTPRWISEAPYTLVGVLNGMIGSEEEVPIVRARACFILYQLVTDEKELERTAYVSGSLKALATSIQKLIPPAETPWFEDEAEAMSLLLEAALTATASLTLHRDDNRLALLEDSPNIIPLISRSLSHTRPGVRYAACQCVRALSRSVSVLRTNIGDSKLAEVLFEIVKHDGDERVVLVALMGIANMVNDFSPTRKILIDSGVVRKLSEIIKTGDEEMKTNSIWALRNALYHSTRAEMESIMNELGWSEFSSLLSHPKARIREISSAAVTNMMARSDDVKFVLESLPNVLSLLQELVQPSIDEAATINALKAISNFSTVYRDQVISEPSLLRAIRDSILHSSPSVRKAAVVCVVNLVLGQTQHQEIRNAEIDVALNGLIQSRSSGSPLGTASGGGSSSSGNMSVTVFNSSSTAGMFDGFGWENDKETKENARTALQFINGK